MDNVIINRRTLPRAAAELLPRELLWEIEQAPLGFAVEEIRVKASRRIWVCGEGKNAMLHVSANEDELEEILLRACGGSLYACAESIKNGFVSAREGVRVGVCGDWTVGGVRKISSLAIRIPHRINADASEFRAVLEGFGYARGLLLFSPPLGGKTSMLREIARELSSGDEPKRVVVVDTRGELGFSLDGESLCLDILSGYPRRVGIEIAARTLGAQVVVCDEIGAGESEAICELHGGGVPLVASAHAADLADLLSRRGIAELHRAGVFGGYVELSRHADPPYKIHMRGESLDN